MNIRASIALAACAVVTLTSCSLGSSTRQKLVAEACEVPVAKVPADDEWTIDTNPDNFVLERADGTPEVNAFLGEYGYARITFSGGTTVDQVESDVRIAAVNCYDSSTDVIPARTMNVSWATDKKTYTLESTYIDGHLTDPEAVSAPRSDTNASAGTGQWRELVEEPAAAEDSSTTRTILGYTSEDLHPTTEVVLPKEYDLGDSTTKDIRDEILRALANSGRDEFKVQHDTISCRAEEDGSVRVGVPYSCTAEDEWGVVAFTAEYVHKGKRTLMRFSWHI